MYFLHHDAEIAASYICDQDVFQQITEGLCALRGLYDWVQEDGLNYHWLAYYCDRLQHRLPGSEFYSEIMSLRRNVPESLRCIKMTPFPVSVSAYRLSYFENRWAIASWKEGMPAWFLRLAAMKLDTDNFGELVARSPQPVIRYDDLDVGEPKLSSPSGIITTEQGTFELF